MGLQEDLRAAWARKVGVRKKYAPRTPTPAQIKKFVEKQKSREIGNLSWEEYLEEFSPTEKDLREKDD